MYARVSLLHVEGRNSIFFWVGGGGEGAAASSLARKESDCVARVGETSVFSI